jgi:hypothetical protein
VGGEAVRYVITYSTITLVTPSRWSVNLTSKNYVSWHSYLKNHLIEFSKNLTIELHQYKDNYSRITKSLFT